MAALKASIAELKPADKVILDLSKYTALLAAYEADVADDDTVDPGNDSNSEKPAFPWETLLIISAIVIVLAGMGVGAYLYFGKRKTNPDGSEVSEDQETEPVQKNDDDQETEPTKNGEEEETESAKETEVDEETMKGDDQQ